MLMKSFLPLLLLVTVTFCCTSCGPKAATENSTASTAPTEKILPALALQHADGGAFEVSSLLGKKVMVNLWASWCGPCREEMPSIEALAQSIDTSKAAVVLISLDEDKADGMRFLQGKNLQRWAYFPTADLPDIFNVPGIPATFFFNEKGEMIKEIVGTEDYNTPAFKQLLQ